MALPAHSDVQVWREPDGASPDRVAEEVPVALRYNGQPHVVMMCTPADLEDFARGFSVTEDIVERVEEVEAVSVVELDDPQGFEIDIRIPARRAALLGGRERNLQGRTGCGLCGAREIAETVRPVRRVPAGATLGVPAIRRALDGLRKQQPLNAATGATHAAAWATPDGLIVAAREDVGRHNALDKLVGASLLADELPWGERIVMVSGRLSFELVQKAARAGAAVLAGVSAPSSLAVELAEACGITLCGFVRGERFNVYAGGARIAPAVHR